MQTNELEFAVILTAAVGWTAWNHVRTVAALGASVSLTIALYGS